MTSPKFLLAMRIYVYILIAGIVSISCASKEGEKRQITVNADAVIDTAQMIQDLRILSADDMGGRRTGTVGSAKAQAYLIGRLENLEVPGYKGSHSHQFTFINREEQEMWGTNIIGYVQGRTDSMIVITAHFDHLGNREGEIYNGADDDASGTAAVLAFADFFNQNQPYHSMVFALFDAEEMGLRGARAFVEDEDMLAKVKMNINLDMVGNSLVNELYAAGTYHHPQFKPILEGIEKEGELNLLFGHDTPEEGYNDWTTASDHGPFHQKGVPFIYFGVEDHEHYHKPSDDFETIPLPFYKASAQTILNAILAFDAQL
ncbi:MAG: M28 family peptidase [Bacteroidota bacterium]